MILLRATALSRERRGALVLDSVDIELETGELLAVAGPNGAGKSTLLRLLGGDLAPTRGEVEIGGDPIERLPRAELARRRAVMPQHTSIGFGFTVRQVVEMGCHPLRDAYDGLTSVVADALDRAGIAHLADRTFRTLSGESRRSPRSRACSCSARRSCSSTSRPRRSTSITRSG